MGELQRVTTSRPALVPAARGTETAARARSERETIVFPLQRAATRGVAQTKLAVGAADDPFEREAERTADAVTAPQGSLQFGGGGIHAHGLAASLMRFVSRALGKTEVPTKKDDDDKKKVVQKESAGPGPSVAPPSVEGSIERMMAGGGSPLSPGVRSTLEPRFGFDFRDVRTHTSGEAAGAATALGARAFTVGDHIFFGAGEYQPSSAQGQRLMAHELTHTIQQKPMGARAARMLARPVTAAPASAAPVSAAPKRVQRLFDDTKKAIREKVKEFITRDFPPWDLITLIIGWDPIAEKAVKGATRDWIHAAMKLAPDGEALFDRLDKEGKIDSVVKWWDAQVAKLDLSMAKIIALANQAWAAVGIADITDPVGAWNKKIKPIFEPTVLRVWDFIKEVGGKILAVVKDLVLNQLGEWARKQKGYPLLTMILGKDPVTGEEVKPTLKGVIFAVLDLVDGGDKIKENLEKSKTIEKAAEWFKTEVKKLDLTWEGIKALFSKAWDAFKVADLLNPKLLFEKMAAIFGPPVGRLLNFLIAVGKKVLEFIFEGAMLIAGPIGLQIVGIVKKIGDTFHKIIDDPVAFVGHLVDAVKKGIAQFAKNIWDHLKTGLIEWLVGTLEGAGLVLPKVWDLKGILDLVLQILGITYAKIRGKLVKVLGEKTVSMLEKAFEFIKTLVTEGPAAAWKQIVDAIGGLWDLVIGGIKDWAVTKIVTAAITKLATMFNPAGAVIQAIIATYNTVAFFIERIKQILAFVEAVVDSIANIANGKIDAAANWVEKAMARTIPVILGFLARLIGLGDVSEAIKKVIKAIQEKVDKGIDFVIDWVVKKAKSLFGKDDTPEEKNAAGVKGAADVTEPFQMGAASHHLRAHQDGLKVKFFMASEGEDDLVKKIADLRLYYTHRYNEKDPKRASAIGARLDQISARVDGVGGLMAKAPDAAAATQVMRAEEIAIKMMLSQLGTDFGIRGLRFTPPTHRFAPQSTDAYLRATVVAGDPISEASRVLPPSPASGNVVGLSLVPGYERGHLLADSLGGPGGDARNLSPMSNLTNRGAAGMPRAEGAARKAIDLGTDPPTILRYTVRAQYANPAGLETWAASTLNAAPGSAHRLFVAVRNGALADSDLHAALGGTARVPLIDVQNNRVKLIRQVAYHFLATGYDISIDTIEGPAVPQPGFIPNHIGVTLP